MFYIEEGKMNTLLVTLLVIYFISLSNGLDIDVKVKNEDQCDLRTLQIICRSSPTEMGSSKLTIAMGSTELTACQRNGMNCSKVKDDSRYSAPMFDGETAMLEVKMADFTNYSVTWSCMVGNNKAQTKLLFLGPDPCGKKSVEWHSVISGMTAVIIIAALVVIVVILGFCLLCKICREKCKGCCRRHAGSPNQNGYTGKHYDVKMSYTVEDPEHVPDASAKDMPIRTDEAKKDCSKFSDDQKEAATEKLKQYVSHRTPQQETAQPLLAS